MVYRGVILIRSYVTLISKRVGERERSFLQISVVVEE